VAKNLLIIFYRNPELGKVKTRLAATLGDANALAIYLKLVNHTRTITEKLQVNKVVYYSHFIDKEDSWDNTNYKKSLQVGDTLGEKLEHAVAVGFKEGYSAVAVIGSDCFELNQNILEEAFKALSINDAVIGPAKDGGYYLLGLRKFVPEIFRDKKWSTASVASETLKDFEEMGLKYQQLPMLTDVDVEEDLPQELLLKIKK